MRAGSLAWSLLVTRQRWRAHHSISYSRKPYAISYANLIALCLIGPELPIEVLHSSCDLDLDPIIFIYELDLYFLDIYWMCENELPTSRYSKVIVRQTYRQTGGAEIIYYMKDH